MANDFDMSQSEIGNDLMRVRERALQLEDGPELEAIHGLLVGVICAVERERGGSPVYHLTNALLAELRASKGPPGAECPVNSAIATFLDRFTSQVPNLHGTLSDLKTYSDGVCWPCAHGKHEFCYAVDGRHLCRCTTCSAALPAQPDEPKEGASNA
jgi:hypothetical protein